MSTHLPLRFPNPFRHDHPPVRDVNALVDARITVGERCADGVASMMGSWKFIIVQTMILAAWMTLNVVALIHHWDPYPFILMNLVLSTQAAYAAPIIMMSQNRQAERDRLEAHNDFEINKKAEIEIAQVMAHLEAQDLALQEMHRLLARLSAHVGMDPAPAEPLPE